MNLLISDAASRRRFRRSRGSSVRQSVLAQRSKLSFENWVEQFRARAKARGISDAVYNSALKGIKPDTSVYAQDRSQPEFQERAWQYLNRRVSEWLIATGRSAPANMKRC